MTTTSALNKREPARQRAAWVWTGRGVWLLFFLLATAVLLVGCWKICTLGLLPCSDPTNATWFYCNRYFAGVQQLGFSQSVFAATQALPPLLAGLPYLALSVIVMRRRSDRLMAVLFALLLAGLGAVGKWQAPIVDWASPLEHNWLYQLLRVVPFVVFGGGLLVLFVFPDGRWVPGWTRWLALPWLALQAGQYLFQPTGLNYWNWPDPIGQIVNLSAVLAGLYALRYRYRRVADGAQRQQIKWFAFGASLLLLSYLVDFTVWNIYPELTGGGMLIQPGLPAVLWQLIQGTAWYAAQAFWAVCIGFAIFRYRLWDIDLLINRTLVYAGLTASVVGVYVLIVSLLGAVIRSGATGLLSLLATGVVAVLAQPLRDRLQRGVNRLMYGERDDPVTVLARLGQRLETAVTPEAVLPSLVETVAQALKLPYVAVELGAEGQPPERVAFPAAAPAPAQLTVLPLLYQGDSLGRLVVAPRAAGEAFSPLDQHLLENIARQAGLAVHAVGLTRALRRARQRAVAELEDERRRLRRDLHDGLGPALASQGLKLAAALQHLRGNPATAAQLIEGVMAQNTETVKDVRRLVYGLRPPALDERGLAEAIRDHVGAGTPEGLQVRVDDLPAGTPPLPAAVEVAAYRIALEALTNVIRHAQARLAAIHFQVTQVGAAPALEVAIEDDGRGLSPAARAGVGLRSMRERTDELGGTLRVEVGAAGGTRVTAVLPLAEA